MNNVITDIANGDGFSQRNGWFGRIVRQTIKLSDFTSHPIISVMGVGYNVSKFDVQLYLREMFLKKGYKVAQIGTKKISNIMGVYSIPDFM